MMREIWIVLLLWLPVGLGAQTYSAGYQSDGYNAGGYQVVRHYDLPTYEATPEPALCLTCNHCQVPTTPLLLPLDWLEFDAKRFDSQDVEVQWFMESLTDVRQINLYVRQEGDPFMLLASMGHSMEGEFIHRHAPPTRLYYQLEITYLNGGVEWSPVREVAAIEQVPVLRLYPNPGQEEIMVETSGLESGMIVMSVFDSRGQQIETWRKEFIAGSVIRMPVSVPGGLYLVELRQGSLVLRGKWIRE